MISTAQSFSQGGLHGDVMILRNGKYVEMQSGFVTAEGDWDRKRVGVRDGKFNTGRLAQGAYNVMATKPGYRQMNGFEKAYVVSDAPTKFPIPFLEMRPQLASGAPQPSAGRRGLLHATAVPRLVLVLVMSQAQDQRRAQSAQTVLCAPLKSRVIIGPAGVGQLKVKVQIHIQRDDEVMVYASTAPDSSGAFEFSSVFPPGIDEFLLTVSAPGHRDFSEAYAPCDALPATIALQPTENRDQSGGLGQNPTTAIMEGSRRYVLIPPGLTSLPLIGSRGVDSLALLLPGVAPPAGSLLPDASALGVPVNLTGQFAINGMRSRENNFTVDGSDNNDEDIGVRRQGFVLPPPVSVESVDEFQVISALADARFGRNLGGQVNLLTKRAVAGFHGTAFGFVTDHRLNARNFFDFTGGPAPGENPLTRVQTGVTAGGPVNPKSGNPTFFQGTWERHAVNASQEQHFAVPVAADREIRSPKRLRNELKNRGLAPTSMAGEAIFSLFPSPNNPAGPYGDNTYTTQLPADRNGTLLSGSVDQGFRTFGWKHTASGRYHWGDEQSVLPAHGEALFASLLPKLRVQNPTFSLHTDLNSNWSHTLRASYGRSDWRFGNIRHSFLLPSRDEFLLNARLDLRDSRYNDITSSEQITGPLGQLKIAGYSPLGIDVYNFPQARLNKTWQVASTTSFVRGSHSIFFGFDFRRTRINTSVQRNFRPLAVFNGLRGDETEASKLHPKPDELISGSTLAAMGLPTGLFQVLAYPDYASADLGLRMVQLNWFVHDEIRLWPNFHLSWGLRYELNRVPRTDGNTLESAFDKEEVLRQTRAALARPELPCVLDPTAGDICPGLEEGLRKYLPTGFREAFNSDRNDIQPRLGFAWDLNGSGRTVIRGGFGAYAGQFPGIVVNQSRSVFPRLLSLNYAQLSPRVRKGQNGQYRQYLFNLAHPVYQRGGDAVLDPEQELVEPGKLYVMTNPMNLPAAGRTVPALAFHIPSVAWKLGGQHLSDTALNLTLPAAGLSGPYAFHYGLTLQRQIVGDSVATVSYVGTGGRKLLRTTTPDLGLNRRSFFLATGTEFITRKPLQPAMKLDRTDGTVHYPYFIGNLVSPQSAVRWVPDEHPCAGRTGLLGDRFAIVRTLYESGVSSTYNSLQLQYEKRNVAGLQLGAAFTYSHAIDAASDFVDNRNAFALPQDSCRSSERGSSNFDSRLRAAAHFFWDTGRVPRLQQIGWLRDWEMAGVVTMQSGQPFTVNSAFDVNRDGNLTDRLDHTEGLEIGVDPADSRSRLRLRKGVDAKDLLAIGECALSEATCNGRVGRNTFSTWGLANVDLSISRRFRITEQMSMLFRVEAFNVLNRVHFGFPVRILEAPEFGSATDLQVPARVIQFSLKLSF